MNPGFGENGTFYSIFFTDLNTGYTTGTVTMLKTTNAGQSWFYQSVSGYNGDLRSVYFTNGNTGYTVGNVGQIYKTTNAGNNWYSQTTGTTRNLKNVFFANATTGWAVGDSGIILKTTDGGGPIGIIPISIEIPSNYRLEQNYPNPFNASSKFKIQISKLSEVKVVVYDILGREMVTLVNEQLKPGTYEVEFNGSNYPSGTYFYRLNAKDYTETKRMVLAK